MRHGSQRCCWRLLVRVLNLVAQISLADKHTNAIAATRKAKVIEKCYSFCLYRLNSLTARLLRLIKYLPLPNQLHYWTRHVQSIVKVKNQVRRPGGNSKVGWQSLFSNLVGQTVRLNGPVHLSKILIPNITT